MLFSEYKAEFDRRRASLKLPVDATQKGIGCQTKARPAMPPWVMDWAVLYANGMHFRVKETYKCSPHPHYAQGQRLHFCYQYGATTGVDAKGMPITILDADTVIRLDQDRFGPHMHYSGRNHVKQESLTGKFRIAEAEVFAFIEGVETHRMSGSSFEEIFFFGLKEGIRG